MENTANTLLGFIMGSSTGSADFFATQPALGSSGALGGTPAY